MNTDISMGERHPIQHHCYTTTEILFTNFVALMIGYNDIA